jgi:hypothetical protein
MAQSADMHVSASYASSVHAAWYTYKHQFLAEALQLHFSQHSAPC